MRVLDRLAKNYATDNAQFYRSMEEVQKAYKAGFEKARDLFVARFGTLEKGHYWSKMADLGENECE